MSDSGDDVDEMRSTEFLDDATAEAVLRGDPAGADLAPLAEAVDAIRATATTPVAPSADLAARMAAGDFSGVPAAPPPEGTTPTRRIGAGALAAMGWRARAALGVTVVLLGFSGAAVAGALPDSVTDRFRGLVESLTSLDFAEGVRVGPQFAERSGAGADHGGNTPGSTGQPVDSTDGDTPSEQRPAAPGVGRGAEESGDRGGADDTGTDPGDRGNRPDDPGDRGNRPDDSEDRGNRPDGPAQPENRPDKPGRPGNAGGQGAPPDHADGQSPPDEARNSDADQGSGSASDSANTSGGTSSGRPGNGRAEAPPGQDDGGGPPTGSGRAGGR